MKKNKPYYLKYYKEWAKRGYMDCPVDSHAYGGLCGSSIGSDPLFHLFHPAANKWLCNAGYWASGTDTPLAFDFTPLRQTIVLFLAAMHNEL